MRAVIRLKTNDARLNQLSLEGFLQSEDFSLVDLIKDENWLNLPDQKPLLDKIENIKQTIFPLEARDINPFAYIYNQHTEGLVSFNPQSGLYGIRIFKHNKDELMRSCENLVESLISYFDRNETKLDVQSVRIREKGQPEDTITGDVFKDKRHKIKKARIEKRTEFRLSSLLLAIAFFCILVSLGANIFYDFNLEGKPGLGNWLVHFFERITGPLLITGSVLFYNYWAYKSKIMKSSSVIFWR